MSGSEDDDAFIFESEPINKAGLLERSIESCQKSKNSIFSATASYSDDSGDSKRSYQTRCVRTFERSTCQARSTQVLEKQTKIAIVEKCGAGYNDSSSN